MMELRGKFGTAKVFTDVVDEESVNQVITLLNQPYIEGSKIRMMPDIHAGAGCTIGTTMTVKDKICPNLVGVDIGCGMETIRIKEKHIEPQKLDKLIRAEIPSGFDIRSAPHRYANDIDLSELYCIKKVNPDRAYRSIGTLGGGNHFIEANKDDNSNIYIVVHSGSRHLGLEIAKYYQELAYNEHSHLPKPLAYVEGTLFDQYLHDMRIAQRFAELNRKAMMDTIVKGMKLHVTDQFTTIHNYIDVDNMILRKGAVSAKKGERLLIPINMRDGSLICTGKGNEDWNCSAPHGAGRLMSRKAAKGAFTVSEFKKQMEGIYTTSVNRETLDECPMAYKTMDDIVNNIDTTVTIEAVIKPIYNFKAGEE
ncbi:MAG: RtcB family protein [Ruminococcaceae bacterium]|nr:RtcB family protein [Oscillospiraceae bacterium]